MLIKNDPKKISKNASGFLLLILILAIALAGVIFAVYYAKRIDSSRQTIQDVESQKEYMEKQLQNSVKDLQEQIKVPQGLPSE